MDELGAAPVTRHDLHATGLHLPGIDREQLTFVNASTMAARSITVAAERGI